MLTWAMDLLANENVYLVVVTVITIWSTLLKGIALWRAANHKQINWFIVMLIINTVGILELVYLFRFSKKRLTKNEIKSWIDKIKKR